MQEDVLVFQDPTQVDPANTVGKLLLHVKSMDQERATAEDLGLADHYCQGDYYYEFCKVRWLPCFQFEELPLQKKKKNTTEEPCLLLSVYCTNLSDDLFDELRGKMSAQHDNVRCGIHDTPFNVIARMKDFKCSIADCDRLVGARCLGDSITECPVGICKKHWKEFSVVGRHVYGFMKPVECPSEESLDATYEPMDIDDAQHEPLLDMFGNDIYETFVFNQATGGNQATFPEDASLFTRLDTVPIYDVNRRLMPGHFYVNDSLNVYKSRHFHGQAVPHPILSCIVNNMIGHSEALLYPEAMLFPTIFWDYNQDVCSYPGALPSYFFFEGGKFVPKEFGSLKEHMKVRIRDNLCFTSTYPPYLHFWFDVVVNNALSHTTASMITNRGLEFVPQLREKAVSKECFFSFDEDTSSKKKKELSYLIREGRWDYFVTLTANDTLSPGLCKIQAAMEKIAEGDSNKLLMLDQEYQNVKVKSWRRTIQALQRYFMESPDQVLGPIKTYFLRYEFQSKGSVGNKPHIHMGVSLKEEPEEKTLSRICCQTRLLFNDYFKTDEVTLTKQGLVDEHFTYSDILGLATLQQHHCEATNGRCMRRNAEGQEHCRVPVHPERDYAWFEDLAPFKMDEDLANILQDLGLCEIVNAEVVYDEKLRSGRWHYPSDGVKDKACPTVPALLAVFKSTTNVQHCDARFQVAYLIKYITKEESHAYVYNRNQKTMQDVSLESDTVRNMSYASEKKAQALQDEERVPVAREISFQEVLWHLNGFEYCGTNVNFVHVSTFPPELRGGVLRYSRGGKKDATCNAPDINEGREALPAWRRYTDNQAILRDSYMNSKFSLDNTSKFNMRPPELVVFSNLCSFFKWFVRLGKKGTQTTVSDVKNTLWIDGLGYQWKIRAQYVQDACEYLRRNGTDNEACLELLAAIFDPLVQEEDETLLVNFVDSSDSRPVVVVCSLTKANAPAQFLYHLWLTLGNCTTELDFATKRSPCDCLRASGLFHDDLSKEENLHNVFKEYVTTDLIYHPCNGQQLGKNLKATSAFFKAVASDEFDLGYIMFEEEMVTQSKENLKSFWDSTRDNVVESARSMGISIPQVLSLDWKPELIQGPTQTDASFEEQKLGLDVCLKAIDALNKKDSRLQFPVLAGPPGTGKTHIMLMAALYALAQGKNVIMTSITGERATVLGGVHLHKLLNLPVVGGNYSSVEFLVKGAVDRLYRNPVKLAKLVQTDVFFIDEIGMLSAEMFSVLDRVLQTIMGSRKPLGGKLCFGSGDCHQLPPIDGHSLWISVYMLTCFQLFTLREYVRAEGDVNLRTVLQILRKSAITDEDIEHVWDIMNACCNVVGHWDLVPAMALRIVSTRAAEKRSTNHYLNLLESSGTSLFHFIATDEMESSRGVWQKASSKYTSRISKDCLEQAILTLYNGAIVRMTYNHSVGDVQFNQGQLAIVCEVPDSNLPVKDQRLGLLVVPPGCTSWDVPHPNWQRITVGIHITAVLSVGNGRHRFRRQQWPVVLHVSSTVHKIIGSTCSLVATELNQQDKSLRLWQREQFVVLVSRVRRLEDLYLVGQRTCIRAAIFSICKIEDMWRDFISSVVNNCAINVRQEKEICLSPFMDFYKHLPNTECVYILYSFSKKKCYCGETENFIRRLRQHNSGFGAASTREGRPWSCLALVTGIIGGEAERRNIERQIHFWIGRNTQASPRQLIDYATVLVTELNNGRAFEYLKCTSFMTTDVSTML
jgi:predicted GIY-YIG superfamily endonuclease/DNA replication protein DnaC